jgi:hypothetical protein
MRVYLWSDRDYPDPYFMKIAYLLSSVFPYDRLICTDAGPAIAEEYGWHSCTISSLANDSYDVIVIDNRHHNVAELESLRSYIVSHDKNFFLLRVNDPFVFHQSDPWYQFCASLLDATRVHFLSPYQPTGILSYWLSNSIHTQCVYAPYTYDATLETSCIHLRRHRRVAVSGNQRRDLYPKRFWVQKVSKFSLSNFVFRTQRLSHPGYPEKCGSPSHQIMGSAYVKWLSKYTAAFTDSSIYRIELLKYREIAYAGCAPIGDLPWSLFDCPSTAFFQFRTVVDLIRFRSVLSDPQATEVAAQHYREYMRTTRCRSFWRNKVSRSLACLL